MNRGYIIIHGRESLESSHILSNSTVGRNAATFSMTRGRRIRITVPALAGRRRGNVGVRARDGRLGAIDKPVSHRWLTGMWQQAGIGGDASGMYIGRTDEVVGREVIEVGNVLHHVVPDGTGPGDTDDVIHG